MLETRALARIYDELNTPEGENIVCRLARSRDKAANDFTHLKQLKKLERGQI